MLKRGIVDVVYKMIYRVCKKKLLGVCKLKNKCKMVCKLFV